MKTAYLLFGLAGAACATSPQAQYPLCDPSGAPACGNIGQVGRTQRGPSAPSELEASAATPTVVSTLGAIGPAVTRIAPAVTRIAPAVTRVAPAITRVLVAASREIESTALVARPLVDHREQLACGNVMSKTGRMRECRDADGTIISVRRYNDNDPLVDVE